MRTLILALICLPLPASALRCIVPTAGQSARMILNAGETPIVMRGDLRYLPDQDLGEELVDGGIDIRVRAMLSGRRMTATGYGEPTEIEVEQRYFCHAPWCSGPLDAAGIDDAFFVLRDTRHGPTFESGMCQFNVYAASDEREADVFACLKGGPECTPPER